MNQPLISESLENALDQIRLPHAYFKDIAKLVSEIDDLNGQLSLKKLALTHSVDLLYAALATEIRKRCPKLCITLTKDGCMISFKSRSIVCKVDPYKKAWDFGNNDFAKLLLSKNPNINNLDSDLDILAKTIGDHFSYQYRSLV